jgi:hypothetical protein
MLRNHYCFAIHQNRLGPSEREASRGSGSRSSAKFEPTSSRVVVLLKENPMIIDDDALCEDLRAWMKSPAIGLPEYSDDPVIQRRVGKMLAETLTYIHAIRAKT